MPSSPRARSQPHDHIAINHCLSQAHLAACNDLLPKISDGTSCRIANAVDGWPQAWDECLANSLAELAAHIACRQEKRIHRRVVTSRLASPTPARRAVGQGGHSQRLHSNLRRRCHTSAERQISWNGDHANGGETSQSSTDGLKTTRHCGHR